MKIYVAHSTNSDYINDIYKPIKAANELKMYEIIFPHEEDNYLHARDYYNDFSLAICEISNPSTGLGIELGFLYDSKVPIYCFYKHGKDYSKSIAAITDNIYEYSDTVDFVKKVKIAIERGSNETRSI